MIESLFQSSLDRAADDADRRPQSNGPLTPINAFSLSAFGRSTYRALGAAGAEALAFGADITGAFGQVGGAYPEALGVTPTAEQRKQSDAARTRLLAQGVDYSSEQGDKLRTTAASLMPDPVTADLATSSVAGLVRFGGKAVAHTLAFGPVAPFTLGADEGLSEADRLKREGVDLATRTKVGAVHSVAAGASLLLPVVGTTAARTAGAVALAGPGTFMAEQSQAQMILRNAGQEHLATTYDPFNPWGLMMSAAVPGVIGGMVHLSGAARARPTLADVAQNIESGGRRYGADGKLLQGPVTRTGERAQGEMQVMPATAADPGFGVAPPRDNSPDALADFGRRYLAAMQERYHDDAKALAAYNAGPGALDRALQQHGDAWLTHMPAETQAYVHRGMAQMAEHETAAAVQAHPELVDAARVHQVVDHIESTRLGPDDSIPARNAHADALALAHDQVAAGERVDVARVAMADEAAARTRLEEKLAERAHEGPEPWEQPVERIPFAQLPAAAERADDLRYLARGAGWATEGGKLLRAAPEPGAGAVGAVTGRTPWVAAEEWFGRMRQELGRGGLANPAEIRDAIERAIAGEPLKAREQRTVDWMRQEAEAVRESMRAQEFVPEDAHAIASDMMEHGLSRFDAHEAALVSRAGAIDPAALEDAHYAHPTDDAAFLAAARRIVDGEAAKQQAGSPDGGGAPARGPQGAAARGEPAAAAGGTGPEAVGPANLTHAVDEVAALRPDMLVELDGMQPMTVRELLDAVRAEAAEDAKDGKLVEAAVSCLLRHA